MSPFTVEQTLDKTRIRSWLHEASWEEVDFVAHIDETGLLEQRMPRGIGVGNADGLSARRTGE